MRRRNSIAALLRRLEPWAPPPAARLEVLRRLAEAGLDTGLLLAPILPGLTDSRRDLAELLSRVRDAGIRRLSWNVLFLRSSTREHLLAWLDQARPRLAAACRRAYARGAYAPRRYRAGIDDRVGALVRELGLTRTSDAGGLAAALPAAQLALPFAAPRVQAGVDERRHVARS